MSHPQEANMLFSRSTRLAAFVLTVTGLALLAAPSTGKEKAAKARPQVVRVTYETHGGSAKDLADVITPHFKNQPIVVLPGPGNKTLLLSGPQAIVQDAFTLLKEIDRPAHRLHFDILLVELAGKGVERTEFSGPAAGVLAKIKDLEQKGTISSVHRFEVIVLERDTAHVKTCQNKSYVAGLSRGSGYSGGGVSRSLASRDVGTVIQVMKPEIAADGQVEMQIQLEDTQMRAPTGGPDLGTDEKGASVAATEFDITNLDARLRIPRGHLVATEGELTSSKAGQGQKLILVGVRAE
jgi:type II secretory pathway component GspD/PulD (secretin)